LLGDEPANLVRFEQSSTAHLEARDLAPAHESVDAALRDAEDFGDLVDAHQGFERRRGEWGVTGCHPLPRYGASRTELLAKFRWLVDPENACLA
jgi:hypothetical protein